MKRLPGCLLFTAAAIYLITQGELDLFALPAALLCAVCAVIVFTKNHLWALIIGVGLIAVSLAMQIRLDYFCAFCLKSDMLILAAVVSLAIMQKGRFQVVARVVTGVACVLLLGVTTVAAPELTSNAAISTAPDELGDDTLSLAQEKPVLLFSPSCGSCGEVVTALTEIDPAGEYWLAVQSGGPKDAGDSYLREKGYTGEAAIYQSLAHTVPALLVESNDQVTVVYGTKNIVEIVSGKMPESGAR